MGELEVLMAAANVALIFRSENIVHLAGWDTRKLIETKLDIFNNLASGPICFLVKAEWVPAERSNFVGQSA